VLTLRVCVRGGAGRVRGGCGASHHCSAARTLAVSHAASWRAASRSASTYVPTCCSRAALMLVSASVHSATDAHLEDSLGSSQRYDRLV
jgi:hypothetical protein